MQIINGVCFKELSDLTPLDRKYHGKSFLDMIQSYNELNKKRLRYYDKKSKKHMKKDAKFAQIKQERSYLVKRINYCLKDGNLSIEWNNSGKIIGLKRGKSLLLGSSGWDYYE